MINKTKSLKVYRFRIDEEDKNGYSENMTGFDILAETFDEAVEEAKKRIAKSKYYVIGEIELVSVIE